MDAVISRSSDVSSDVSSDASTDASTAADGYGAAPGEKPPKRVAPVAVSVAATTTRLTTGFEPARPARKRIQPTATTTVASTVSAVSPAPGVSSFAPNSPAPPGVSSFAPNSPNPPGVSSSFAPNSPAGAPLTPPPLRRDAPRDRLARAQGPPPSDDVDRATASDESRAGSNLGRGIDSRAEIDPNPSRARVDPASAFRTLLPAARRAAELHGAALAGGAASDLSVEMAFVLRLLAVKEDVFDAPRAGLIPDGDAARRYASLVVSRAGRVPSASGEAALTALVGSSALRRHAPATRESLARRLAAFRRAETLNLARSGDGGGVGVLLPAPLMAAAGPAPPRGVGGVAGFVAAGFVAAGFGAAANTQQAYHNREKARDALYAQLRALAGEVDAVGRFASGSGPRPGHGHGPGHAQGLSSRVRDLLAGVRPENTRWFAELLVSRLVQAAAAGEADEELAAAVTPARLSKLHRRLTGETTTSDSAGLAAAANASSRPGVGAGAARSRPGGSRRGSGVARGHGDHGGGDPTSSFACMFPPAQRPYVRLVEAADSHRLASAMTRALVAALHALDRNARPPSPSRDGDGDGSSSEIEAGFMTTLSAGNGSFRAGGGVTERALAAEAVAGVLGVLAFGSGASGAGAADGTALAPTPGVDCDGALRRAARNGQLVVTVPWVIAFLRFLPWDAEAATAPCHLAPLATLRAMGSSPKLSPARVAEFSDEFTATRATIRTILARGLEAKAPTTPAACAAFAGRATPGKSRAPPPPPPAHFASLPPTRRRASASTDDDPLRYWGADANGEGDDAPPDLREGSLDRRYLESKCPELDRAAAALAAATAEEKIEDAEANGGQLDRAAAFAASPGGRDAAAAPRRRVVATRTEPSSNGSGFGANSTVAGAPGIGNGNATPVAVAVANPTEPSSNGSAWERNDAPGGGSAMAFSAPVTSPGPTAAEAKAKTNATNAKASSSSATRRALQRAFLARRPEVHRVVDFAVDAAAMGAADAASAAAAGPAVARASSAVMGAANVAASTAKLGARLEDAWTPAFEHAVERAAMAAARDALAPAAQRAAEDAAQRAADAVLALLGDDGDDGSSADSGKRDGSSADSATRAAVRGAAAAVARDAAQAAAADRVRRTLPFELHARIQSDARVELKRAMHEARERSRETGGGRMDAEMDAGTRTVATRTEGTPNPRAETGDRSRTMTRTRRPAVRIRGVVLFLSRASRRRRGRRGSSTRPDGARRRDSNRREMCRRRLPDGRRDGRREHLRRRGHLRRLKRRECIFGVRSFGRRTAAALFSPPPREAVSSPGTPLHVRSDASRDALWDALEMSCAAAWRAAASTTSDEDARRALALRVARAVYAPERWIPALASFPEAPFAQRRAEATSRRLVKAFHAGFAASAEAAAALAEVVVAADDVGAVGVAVVLRAAVGLVEDAAERSQETHGRDESVRDGDASVTSAAAARLAALCRDAGEGRTLRRVETATARVDRLSRAP